MPGVRGVLENFGGEIPRTSDRLLPETHAASARNVKLASGELRGLRGLKYLTEISNAKKVYRLPDPLGADGESTWVGFDSKDVDLYRGPLLNDEYERYYKFGDGAPQYSTLARIRAGSSWYLLGIPVPVLAGTVTPGTGADQIMNRYYVYTFVSAYGEEGPPSTPIAAVGADDATWAITGMDTAVTEPTQRNITKKRIYRTVSGYSSAEFFYVAEIDLATASYNDTATDVVVSRNNVLESSQWLPPTSSIQGAAVMPNGFFVAWDDRNVYMSESYRPHAWPPPYDLSTEYPILGAGVFGQSIGIVTEGNPYIGTGSSPESLTLTKSNTIEPGLSRYGIVSMPYGVLYPSQNGLIMLGPNGPDLITRQMVTKNEWLNDYSPSTMVAAQYQSAYIAFKDSTSGVMIDPMEPMATFVQLDRFRNVQNIQTDAFTGEVFVTTSAGSSGIVWEWDAVDQPRSQYTWASKKIRTPHPVNIGAAKIQGEDIEEVAEAEIEAIASAVEWNTVRFAAGPLDFLGGQALGVAPVVTLASPYDVIKVQNQQPVGGSPLISTSVLVASIDSVVLTVYADDRPVYSEYFLGQKCIRLPSGFKADTWQFELTSGKNIYNLTFAETCLGLRDV